MSLLRRNQQTYRILLSHTVFTTTLFNSKASTKTWWGGIIEGALFVLVFAGLASIAMLAVFARSGIDTWIQLSLYIVPIISMLCGHYIFKSSSFKEILNRRLQNNYPREEELGASAGIERKRENGESAREHLSRFLRMRSMKTCFYPVSLVVYQWSVYLIFFYAIGNNEFSGPFHASTNSTSESAHIIPIYLSQEMWLSLYYVFWTAGMYTTGFVACCFILVVDILKIDIKSFLHGIGNGPLIHKPKGTSYRIQPDHGYGATRRDGYRQLHQPHRDPNPLGLLFRAVSLVIGFLTLGLVELASKTPWETQHVSESFESNENRGDIEASDSGLTASTGNVGERGRNGGDPQRGIPPREASKLLIQLMQNVETNSSIFKPFLVLLTFFSVTNLVTHVVAMAVLKIDGFTDLHWWTLARTLFWFLLAIRLLVTVATITNTLVRIVPHIYYLRNVGELTGDKQEWDDFFQLAQTFQFGTRTYGFPLTLNQVASIVAAVNFSFLIVLSLISKTQQ